MLIQFIIKANNDADNARLFKQAVMNEYFECVESLLINSFTGERTVFCHKGFSHLGYGTMLVSFYYDIKDYDFRSMATKRTIRTAWENIAGKIDDDMLSLEVSESRFSFEFKVTD